MNGIKHSIVIVAVLLAALTVDSCEFRTLERENAELMVSIYLPDAVLTKAETGKVNPLNDEKRVTSLDIWVFFHETGTLIRHEAFSAGLDSTGLAHSTVTRFGLPLNDEVFNDLMGGATVDVYVLANISAGTIETRDALDNLVLSGTLFGASTLTMAVPTAGLPMSGVLKDKSVTGGFPVLNMIETVTLKRAVSKIHFVFSQQLSSASGSNPAAPTNANCRIMSIAFDGTTTRDNIARDCQIAEQEYVFKEGAEAISGYIPLENVLTGDPLVSNAQLAQLENPDEYCFQSTAHPGESAQEYESRLHSLLETWPQSQIGPIYLRETRKPISGTITYRIDDPDNPDADPIKTAEFSIGDDLLTRNHSWIVYAYFAEETRTLQLTVAVLPWIYSENTIDYTAGTVNVIRRFTIQETNPSSFTKLPDGDGHYDIFFWHTIDVLEGQQTVSKMDTLRGDIIIATPVGATLCVVPGPGTLPGYTSTTDAISISPMSAEIYPNYNHNNPNNGVIEDCKISFEIICNPAYLAPSGNQYNPAYDNLLEGNYIDLYFYVRIGEEGAAGTRYIDLHSESIDYYRIYLWKDWQNPPDL